MTKEDPMPENEERDPAERMDEAADRAAAELERKASAEDPVSAPADEWPSERVRPARQDDDDTDEERE
jgi:hypothetical protein